MTVSHVADTRQSPVQTLSPLAISFVVLNAILPKADAASPPRANSVHRSTAVPAFAEIPTSFSVVLPAA